MEMFNERIQKLTRAGIQCVIMTGNHDMSGNHHAIKPVRGWLSTVKVVDKPIIENGDGYTAIYVPHTVDIESGAKSFPQLVAALRPKVKPGEPCIFYGHMSVNGAMRNDSCEHTSKTDLSAGDIEATGATHAFLAHFHKHQKVGDGIPIYYGGSLERHRLDEINGERGFYVFDTETQETTRVEYTGQRPMKKIYVESFDEALADICHEVSWNDHIVRIEFEGDEKEYAKIKSNFKELRREFEHRGGVVLKLADVKYVPKEGDEEESTAMSVDDLDLLEMIEKRIDADHDGDEEEKRAIKLLNNDVYKKAEAAK
jgi:DNA repair exonuclease SbcCD nuclease subunit